MNLQEFKAKYPHMMTKEEVDAYLHTLPTPGPMESYAKIPTDIESYSKATKLLFARGKSVGEIATLICRPIEYVNDLLFLEV